MRVASRNYGALRLTIVVFALLGTLLLASPALAQADKSGWGVTFAMSPRWQTPPELDVLFAEEPIDISGSELRIGVVRGRDFGGEWGVSYVRKRIRDGSYVGQPREYCSGDCVLSGTAYTYDHVTLSGVEVHKYVPFATIARRVQIGMNVAGGIAQFSGSVRKEEFDWTFLRDNRGMTIGLVNRPTVVSAVPAKDIFITEGAVPLMKLEIAVAGIIAPGLKVRAGGGVNFPGYQQLGMSVSYLFGTR